MIKYEIAVLERMIAHYTMNIEMFQNLQSDGHSLVNDIADMVANRRLVASLLRMTECLQYPLVFVMVMYFLMVW